MKRTSSFVLFGRAFKNARKDFWVSIQVLLVATILLAILFYVVEHKAQPEEYSNPWQAFVWAITRYIGDPGKFAGAGPVTLVGRWIDTIIGILKILIFAVPAGLVSNGFKKAMEDDKRQSKLMAYSERLKKAFRSKQCRYTRYKVVPRFVSIVDIQASQRMDTKDILDTIDSCKDFRLRNLATTLHQGEHAHDRLVVEHFSLEGKASYGCKIDRGSDVTIVSTSSVSEAGIGHFAYYLALYGGFNYISKEFEQNPDEPRSYYLIDDEKGDMPLSDFLTDLRALTRGENKWAVMMLSASGAEEPQHPTQFHFVHNVQKKLEVQPTTTIHEEQFQRLYQTLSTMLQDEFQFGSDLDDLYLPVGKKNIAMQIGGGKECNAFTLRAAYSVTVWDDRDIAVVRKMAEVIRMQLENKAIEEDKSWKEAAMGFDNNKNKKNNNKAMKTNKLMLSCAALAVLALTSCNGNKGNLAEGASGDLAAYENSSVNAIEQARPTIMVIPGDQTLQNFKCLRTEKANGREYTIRDYKNYLQKDDRAKRIFSTIQDAFNAQNFPLSDFEQTLKQLDSQEALDMADGFEKDAKTQLLTVAQPDIILELSYDTSRDKISMTSHNYGGKGEKNVSFTLNALDAYTNKVVATMTASNIKGESTTETIQASIKNQMPRFQQDITTYFSDILTRGREITVRVAVEKGANVKLSGESIEGDTYADWIIDYIKTHTVKGAYKLQRNTDKELYFVNCRIKLLNEDGTQYGVYDWTRDLQKNLRKNLGLTCSNKAQGLGEVLISVQGIK